MSEQTRPFGLWPSPISPTSMALARPLAGIEWQCGGDGLVWLERRSGQGMLVAGILSGQAPRDLTPELAVRARVGYGGGDFAVAGEQLLFSASGRLYRQPLEAGSARPITPAFGDCAAPTVSPDGRWVLYVHSGEGDDCLAVVDMEGRHWPQRIAQGDDFYMQPAWHPNGQQVAFISWRHPQMPWDGAWLSLATLEPDTGGLPRVTGCQRVAGDEHTAIYQPAFSPDGRTLSFVSDASGWFNLYVLDLATGQQRCLAPDEAEWAEPAWGQGMRSYAWGADGATLYACRTQGGRTQLCRIEAASGAWQALDLEGYTSFAYLTVSRQGLLATVASGPTIPQRVVVIDPSNGTVRCLARSMGELVPQGLYARPAPVSWRAADGQAVHGTFYHPAGATGMTDKPPLLVTVHGGPTGHGDAGFSAQAQFFATRGYAVLDVDYRGSSGYGRAYRDLLQGRWGEYDADDAVDGARHVACAGLADGERMAIMGGSAGGFTVLQALIRNPGVFKAGLCRYGVTNLFTLAADTHKFEARYLDGLVGPLPQAAARYRDYSPALHADQIRDPVAVFQGDEDRVVPPEQAEALVAALRASGVPHIYRVYAGEGHGWRKSETIANYYADVLRFLAQYVLYA